MSARKFVLDMGFLRFQGCSFHRYYDILGLINQHIGDTYVSALDTRTGHRIFRDNLIFSVLSILPVAANIAATIGGYTYSAKTIRMVGLCVNSPLWVIYDVAVGSWAGILDEAASSVSVLVSIARYGWKNMDAPKTENG